LGYLCHSVLELRIIFFIALKQRLDYVFVYFQSLQQVFVLEEQILVFLLEVLHLHEAFL